MTFVVKKDHLTLFFLSKILNAVCVGLVAYYFRRHYNGNPELFFLLMTTTFLIGTFCLLLSCLVSWSTGGIISKTIYVSIPSEITSDNFLPKKLLFQELIYHTMAFLLLLIASIILLVEVTNYRFGANIKEAYMAASIIGIINAGLYLISALLANRHYRGL